MQRKQQRFHYLDEEASGKKYLNTDTFKILSEKKYLDTDTFKILSGKKYLDTDTFKILSEKSM